MAEPAVWLSERAYPTVRMKFDGLDITMERRGLIESPHYMRGEWIVTDIKLPSGGGIMPSDAEFRCNNTILLNAAEATYQDTPEGATYPKHTPRRVRAA
jgi:hypothetical protein